MRILHYGKFYPPYFGGIEKVTYDLVEGMTAKGHKADVLCFSETSHSSSELAPAGYRIIRSGCFAHVASTPLSFRNIFQFCAIASEYDVIHIQLPNPVANLALLLSCTRTKVVVHWQCDIVKQKKLLFFYDPLQQWMLRRADAILASTPTYAEGSPWLCKHLDKVTVVPLGVDVSDKVTNPDKVAEVRARYANKKIVFALGRLIYYKGFEYLVEAAKFLPDDYVVLIGGKGELHDKLNQIIAAENLQGKVFLLGSLPGADMGAYFTACDVFCLPSVERSEAFGLVQAEAMSFGKPVVSTNIPGSGVGWVNKDGVSGFVVEPKNPEALADGIKRTLADPEIYRKLSDGARARFDEQFTTERMVDRVLALYERVLAPPGIVAAGK